MKADSQSVRNPQVSRVPPAAPSCTTQAHDALKASRKRWTALPLLDYQHDRLGPRTFELRNCPLCHSTLYRLVDLSGARYPRDPHIAQKAA